MERPDHLYTWRSKLGWYYYSIRAGNNRLNALRTSPKYGSRSGRNYMVNKEIEEDETLIIHRNEKPPTKRTKK